MTKKIDVSELSAQELYELAKQREQEELDREREAAKAKIEELREKRRELIAAHKKELAAIDKEIRTLGGKGRSSGGTGRNREVTSQILEIIGDEGSIAIGDLKTKLESAGIDTQYLSQQLSYLKRRGQITSPKRSIYTLTS